MSFIVVAKCIVRARVALARLHGCIVDTRKRNSALLKTIWPPVRAKGFYSKTQAQHEYAYFQTKI